MQTLAVSGRTSRRIPILILAVAALVTLASLWTFYTSDAATKAREREARLEATQSGATPAEQTPTLEVAIQVAKSEPSAEIVELAGVLEPVRRTWVAAEIAGRILEVPAREFAPIRKGESIVVLDDALPRAELIRAEASHSLARSELERQRRLGSRSVASEAELDQAIAEERRTYAALLEARTRVSHTKIKAPFDGQVNALDLDPGAYVQPGTQIAEVLDVSEIEVTVLVGDRQLPVLAPGRAARVRVDALGSERFTGSIARVAGSPRAGEQRYPIVVALDNASGRLRPGMLAHVELEVGVQSAIRLPAHAVLREFELDYVFVLDELDRARRVRVRTRPVPFRPDRVEVVEGVSPGDRVVVSALDQLRVGLPVIVR